MPGMRPRLFTPPTTWDTTYQQEYLWVVTKSAATFLATTIASGSNGATLPQATINVASTTGFPTKGAIQIFNGGVLLATVNYTGTSGGNQFTGCTGGTGTLATGQVVTWAGNGGNDWQEQRQTIGGNGAWEDNTDGRQGTATTCPIYPAIPGYQLPNATICLAFVHYDGFLIGFPAQQWLIDVFVPQSSSGTNTSTIQFGDTGSTTLGSNANAAVVVPNATPLTNGLVSAAVPAGVQPGGSSNQSWGGTKKFTTYYTPGGATNNFPAAVLASNSAQLGELDATVWGGAGLVIAIDTAGAATDSGFYPTGLLGFAGVFNSFLGTAASAFPDGTILHPHVIYARQATGGHPTSWEQPATTGGPVAGGIVLLYDPDGCGIDIVPQVAPNASGSLLPARWGCWEATNNNAGPGPTSYTRQRGSYGQLQVTVAGTTYNVKLAADTYSGDGGGNAYVYGGIVAGATETSTGSGGSGTGSGGGGGTISRTNLGTGSGSGTGDITVTLSGLTVPTGVLLVVQVGYVDSTSTLGGITAKWNGLTLSGTGYSPTQACGGGLFGKAGEQCLAITSGATASLTVTTVGATTPLLLVSVEYVSGLAFEAASTQHSSASGAGTTPDTGSAGPATHPNQYVEGCFLVITGSAIAWTNSFTSGAQDVTASLSGTSFTLTEGYRILSSTIATDAALTHTYTDWTGVQQGFV